MLELTKTTLMIKNIENSSNNQTDCDDKEEEKESIKPPQRRESLPEEAASTLNLIQKNIESNQITHDTINKSLLSSSLSLQTQKHETLPIVSTSASITTTTNATTQPQQQQEQLKQQPQSTNIENTTHNFSTIANSSSYQLTDKTDIISTTKRETEITTAPSSSSTITIPSSSTTETQQQKTPSPKPSPRRKNSSSSTKGKISKIPSNSKISSITENYPCSSGNRGCDEDSISKSSESSNELIRNSASVVDSAVTERPKSTSRLSERAKKKSWYNVLYPNYKSRSEDYKKLFKDVPNDDRLIVDYSCALQRDILVQGRLYVSQNYVCFHANIFRWETYLSIKWKDVTAITKDKTALVIPNAISISTAKEKYFFATFTARDKAYLMLFRVWQNTLMNKQMLPQEMWQWVHNCYGDELGLTTDDEDYIDPTSVVNENDSIGDSDFASAVEDINLQSSITSTSYQSGINQRESGSGTGSHGRSLNSNNSGNSSASSGSGSIRKSKSKSYFFNSSNKSNKNSSTTTSGSDNNKQSDSKSAGGLAAATAGGSSGGGGSIDKSSTMKANAKELTLTSAAAKSEESEAANEGSTGSGNNVTARGSTASVNNKELKNSSSTFDNKRKIGKGNLMLECVQNLPTDVSDSSDSEESKIPFLPTTECNSTHEGRQIVHTILPINIDTLFSMLFSKSKFLVDYHALRKSVDLTFGEWVTSSEGKKTRIVNVTVQLAASVGPKASKVTEYQEMRDCSKPGELYSIDVNSVNAGIPYADSFSVLLHFCLVRTVDDHTMLSVHAQIKYKKSVWGVVKGFIEKNTWSGLEDFYGTMLRSIQSEVCIPPAKSKGRRPRRGTAAQIRPVDEVAAAQTKPELIENVLAAHYTPPAHLPAEVEVLSGTPTRGKYKWLSLFVIGLLCFLIALNVILLLKLWRLEERIENDFNNRARMPNLAQLKELPNSHEDWIELLRKQEILHETELHKWHKVLQTAIDLLKKVSVVCQTITRNEKLIQEVEQINDEL